MQAITRRDGVKGGRPVLTGSKLSVAQLAELREGGVSLGEIADAYPGIDGREQVEQAVAWMDEHPETVARLVEDRAAAKARLSDLAKTP